MAGGDPPTAQQAGPGQGEDGDQDHPKELDEEIRLIERLRSKNRQVKDPARKIGHT